jgi:pyruvate,orthophosphate dikinase
MQAMILARDEKNRREALLKLLPMQRRRFRLALFKAMDGFPVLIRTLDPPQYEFLPEREVLMVTDKPRFAAG